MQVTKTLEHSHRKGFVLNDLKGQNILIEVTDAAMGEASLDRLYDIGQYPGPPGTLPFRPVQTLASHASTPAVPHV